MDYRIFRRALRRFRIILWRPRRHLTEEEIKRNLEGLALHNVGHRDFARYNPGTGYRMSSSSTDSSGRSIGSSYR